MTDVNAKVAELMGSEDAADVLVDATASDWRRVLRLLLAQLHVDASELWAEFEEHGFLHGEVFANAEANGVPVSQVARRHAAHDDAPTRVARDLHEACALEFLRTLKPSVRTLELRVGAGAMIGRELCDDIVSEMHANSSSPWWELLRVPWPSDIDEMIYRHPDRDSRLDEAAASWAQGRTLTQFFDQAAPYYVVTDLMVSARLDLALRASPELFAELAEALPLPSMIAQAAHQVLETLKDVSTVIRASQPAYEGDEWAGRFLGIALLRDAVEGANEGLGRLDDDDKARKPILEQVAVLMEVLQEVDVLAAAEVAARVKWDDVWRTRDGRVTQRDRALRDIYSVLVECLAKSGLSCMTIARLARRGGHEPLTRFLHRNDIGRVGGRLPERELMELPHLLLAIDVCAERDQLAEGVDLVELLSEALIARDPGLNLLGTSHSNLVTSPQEFFVPAGRVLAAQPKPVDAFRNIWARLAPQHHRFRYQNLREADSGVLIPSVFWIRSALEAAAFLVVHHPVQAREVWEQALVGALEIWFSQPAIATGVDGFVELCFAYAPYLCDEPDLRIEWIARNLRLIVPTPYLLAACLNLVAANGVNAEQIAQTIARAGVDIDDVRAEVNRLSAISNRTRALKQALDSI